MSVSLSFFEKIKRKLKARKQMVSFARARESELNTVLYIYLGNQWA